MFRKYFSGLGVSIALHAAVFVVAVAVLRAPAKPSAARAVGFDVAAERAPGAAATKVVEAPEPAPAAAKPAAPTRRRAAVAAVSGTTMSPSASPSTSTFTSTSTLTETGAGTGTGTASMDPEAIRSAIQARIQYPRVARAQGIAGTVIVRFRVEADGMPLEISIIQSAGSILDDAARRAVERAAPFSSGVGWVRVPVEFALRP